MACSKCRNASGVDIVLCVFFFFQAEDGIRDLTVTGVQTCALPISLREYAQAVELGGDDAGVRHRYAQALADAGRPGEAELQVRQVIELEPLFAAPYFTLGKVLEARGLGQQALAAYRDYVQRAPSLAPLVPRARARIAALSGMEPDSARQP